MHFFPRKSVLVVDLKTQAKTAKLTIPPSKSPPPSKKCPLALPGGALTTFPCKLRPQIFFLRPGGTRAPSAPPGHTYDDHGSYMDG